MLFYWFALIGFLLDQLAKFLVRMNFTPNQSLPILDKFLYLTYVQNKGAAFGLFSGWLGFLLAIGATVILLILYFYFCCPRSVWSLQIALGLVLAGSMGNIFDRVFLGYVVDYVDVGFWPVFNLADVMINCGVFILIIKFILGEKRNASRHC